MKIGDRVRLNVRGRLLVQKDWKYERLTRQGRIIEATSDLKVWRVKFDGSHKANFWHENFLEGI